LFDDITVMHTSGTSGEVGYFLYAPADYKRQRRAARANRQAFRSLLPCLGLRLSRIRVAFYGATGGHPFVPFSDLRRSTAGRRKTRRRRGGCTRAPHGDPRTKGLGNVTFEVPVVAGIPVNERTRKFQLIVTRNPGEETVKNPG
jgi:hypothetical protein